MIICLFILSQSQNPAPQTRVLRMRLMPTQAQDVPIALAPEGGFVLSSDHASPPVGDLGGFSFTFRIGAPYYFVQLQIEAHGKAVADDPVGQVRIAHGIERR
jgi:hypothetical protein